MRSAVTNPTPNRHHLAGELLELSRDVRRIGCGFRTDPETIALAKDTIAARLCAIARQLEGHAPL